MEIKIEQRGKQKDGKKVDNDQDTKISRSSLPAI